MALFGGGKAAGLPALLKKVQTQSYVSSVELDAILIEIAQHPDLGARSILFMLSDSNPKVRQFGSQRISRLAGKQLIQLLVDAMRGLDPRLRADIAALAAEQEVTQLQDALAPFMHSRQEDERFLALEIIAAHRDWREFLSFLKSALKDGSSALRQRAIRVLRRDCVNPTIRLILAGLLHDADENIRREAIAALSMAPGPDLVEPFFARLPEETREAQRLMVGALAKLAEHPESRLEERLLPILASEDPKLREVAVSLLAQIPNRTQVLRAYLIHSRGLATWLRERTHASIMRMGGDILDALITLMQDSNDDIRVAAMVMARKADDARIVGVTREIFLSDCDWWIRSIAAEVLAQFRDAQNCEILLSRLTDPELRYSILSVLGSMLGPTTVDVLLLTLRDEARGIRLVALESLRPTFETFGDHPIVTKVCQAVAEIARDDAEAMVQEKAADILTSQGPVGSAQLAELRVYLDERETQRLSEITSELQMENKSLHGRNVHAKALESSGSSKPRPSEAPATPAGATPAAQGQPPHAQDANAQPRVAAPGSPARPPRRSSALRPRQS